MLEPAVPPDEAERVGNQCQLNLLDTAQQTPRNVSSCGHAGLQEGAFVIPDALADPRFADNSLVPGGPGVRFYAGMPQAREQLQARRAAPGETSALQALHHGMHSMAGTAGTLGLAEVSRRARTIEHELSGLLTLEGRSAASFDAVAAQLEQWGALA